MLIILQINCFNMESTLSGITQQRAFEVKFEPAQNLDKRCVAFNDSDAVATINYIDSGTVKAITTDFHYFSDQNLIVQFISVPEATYNFISLLQRVSYKVNISGQLEFSGSFSAIKNTQANISNCWNTMTLEYQRTGPDAYISLKATPYFCSITDPEVYFEYNLNNTWHSIQILPNSSSTDGFKFPYDHLSTKFYQIYYQHLNSSQQSLFDYFFTQFTANRLIQIRMKMEYSRPKSDLLSQILSKISSFSTNENECLGDLNLITIAGNAYISNIGNLSATENCVPNAVKFLVQSVFHEAILMVNSSVFEFSQRQSITFSYGEIDEKILELDEYQSQFLFFLAVDDAGSILHEEAFQFDVVISCMQKVSLQVGRFESCLVVFPVRNQRCDAIFQNGVETSIEQVMNNITFQSFLVRIKFEGLNYAQLCYSSGDTVDNSSYQYESGNFEQRQKQYLKGFITSKDVQTYIKTEADYQVLDNVAITDASKVFYILIGVFGTVLIFVVVFVVLLIVRQQ